jgi:hypothetical protein
MTNSNDLQLTPAEVQALTEEAYIYALPLVMSYKTMYFYAVNPNSSQFKAPFNQLFNSANVYTPKDTAVVSPNSDTPYSLMWLDLRAEPVVLSVPEIEKERYYSVMLQDLSTYLLPYLGSRTTGNGAGCYMIAGPDWDGEKPDGIDQVIRANNQFVLAVYRTQLFNPDDLDKVRQIQAGYQVQTLSAFLGTKVPDAPPLIDFPGWDEAAATGNNFITYLNFCLRFVSPGRQERALWARLGKVGVGRGKPFDFACLPADQQSAIKRGVNSAVAKINQKARAVPIAGASEADYNCDWLRRAAVTHMGWGANDRQEACCPLYHTDAEGAPLDAGQHTYTLTFPSGELPPVNAFWSVTIYDAKTQLLIDNPLNRYLINSPMLPDLKKNPDGSLALYIQYVSPGWEKESNWLPAPLGEFYLIIRLCWPRQAALDGRWQPPPLQRGQ